MYKDTFMDVHMCFTNPSKHDLSCLSVRRVLEWEKGFDKPLSSVNTPERYTGQHLNTCRRAKHPDVQDCKCSLL